MSRITSPQRVVLYPQKEIRNSETDKNQLFLACVSQTLTILKSSGQTPSTSDNKTIKEILSIILGLDNNVIVTDEPLIKKFKANALELLRNESIFICAHKTITRGSALLLLKVYLTCNNLDKNTLDKQLINNFWKWINNIFPPDEIDFLDAKQDINKYLTLWLDNKAEGYFIQDTPEVMYANSSLKMFIELFTTDRFAELPNLDKLACQQLSDNERLELIDKIYEIYNSQDGKKLFSSAAKRQILLKTLKSLFVANAPLSATADANTNMANQKQEAFRALSTQQQQKIVSMLTSEYRKNDNFANNLSEINLIYQIFAQITDKKAQIDILWQARNGNFFMKYTGRKAQKVQVQLNQQHLVLLKLFYGPEQNQLFDRLATKMKQSDLTENNIKSLLTLVILCKKDFEYTKGSLSEEVKSHLLTSLEHLKARAPLEIIEELLPSINCITEPWSIKGNFKQWQILKLYNEKRLNSIRDFKIKFMNNFQTLSSKDLYLNPAFKALFIDYRPDAPNNILTEINKIEDQQLKTAMLEQVVSQLGIINKRFHGWLTSIFLEIILSNECYLQSKILETLLFEKLIPNWLEQNSKQVVVPSCIRPNFLNSVFQYLENYKESNPSNYGNLLLTNHFLFNQLICISSTLKNEEISDKAYRLNYEIASLEAVRHFFDGQTNNFNPMTQLIFLSRPVKRNWIEKIKNQFNFGSTCQPKILREAITFNFAELNQFLFAKEDSEHSHPQTVSFDSIKENLLFASCKIYKQLLLPEMKTPTTIEGSVTLPELSLLNFSLLYRQYTRYHKNRDYTKLLSLLGLAREFINHLVDALLGSPDLNSRCTPFSNYLPINFVDYLDQELSKKFAELTNMPENYNVKDYYSHNQKLVLSEKFKREIYTRFNIVSANNEEKANLLIFISASLAKLALIRFTAIENHYIIHLRYLAIAALNSAREISPGM